MIIKNKKELISHGNKKGRAVVIDIIENAIQAVNPYNIVKRLVHIDNERKLIVGELTYDLSNVGNMYVIGAGKATLPIAQALDEILAEHIKKGVVVVKKAQGRKLKAIEVIEAGHPIPNNAGLEGAKKIMELAKEAKERDLVFCVITGGASALLPFPAQGITLEDKKRVTGHLLKCGATISEINVVRKHISGIKGGRLAMRIHPAEIITLIIIDEVADLPWGPTVPDETTFEDAIWVLKRYDLWGRIPVSVRKHLQKGLTDSSLETPKPKDFKGLRAHNIVLANNKIACEKAKIRAEALGFNSMILSTVLEGESREVGIILASIAKEIEKMGRPIKPPCVLILGGETTVTITGQPGNGGPSQELVMGFSLKVSGSEKIVVASVDTDGADGPTDIAGGIADGYTIGRAKEKDIDIYISLKRHNSSYVLKELKDAIITGPTGTNVMDLNIVAITT